MNARRIAIGLALVGAASWAGCYASTEPATEVGPESARLHAHGTANNGAAYSRFEYWQTGSSGRRHNTQPRRWPAGASGPFSEKVTGLAAGTSYSFRVCGSDEGVDGSACAQTRTFTTGPPVEDSVRGSWFVGPGATGDVNAASGPSGENPRGSMRVIWNPGPASPYESFTGYVTCLEVNGNRAAVGAIGQQFITPPGETTTASMLLTLEDGGLNGEDTFRRHPGTSACAGASFESQVSLSDQQMHIVVNDAP